MSTPFVTVPPPLIVLRWLAWNALLATGLWFGALGGVAWAGNLFRFVSWVLALCAVVAFVAASTDAEVSEKLASKPVFLRTNAVLDTAFVCVLAAVGWYWTAVAWVIQGFWSYAAIRTSRDAAKETATP